MTPITLNDSLVPDYGIAVAAQYKFYVAWTWLEDGSLIGMSDGIPVRNTPLPRFGGAMLTSACPLLNVLEVQKALEKREGRPVVVIFWSEQDL